MFEVDLGSRQRRARRVDIYLRAAARLARLRREVRRQAWTVVMVVEEDDDDDGGDQEHASKTRIVFRSGALVMRVKGHEIPP